MNGKGLHLRYARFLAIAGAPQIATRKKTSNLQHVGFIKLNNYGSANDKTTALRSGAAGTATSAGGRAGAQHSSMVVVVVLVVVEEEKEKVMLLLVVIIIGLVIIRDLAKKKRKCIESENLRGLLVFVTAIVVV